MFRKQSPSVIPSIRSGPALRSESFPSVILRSPTRQSLRRSGYGSPAKAESRYGDGASDLSSEARSAKEEATKDLLPLVERQRKQIPRFLLR
jgi:hypothetical protein